MTILPKPNHRKVFVGSKINAQFLQSLLLESDIKSVIRDDGESARRAGFGMDYTNEAKLLVASEDYLKGKHLIDSATDENGNLTAIDEELLAKQAMSTKNIERSPNTKMQMPYRRSTFNLLLNIVIILYSGWRLFPLIQGESLPGWRIALSGALLVFCSWSVIKHFTSKPKA